MKNKTSVNIEGSVLARNTVLNFIGQAVPLIVAIVSIPLIIEGLGTDRFGLLSLAWVVLSYFIIFDLGLGRATTKFVAEALAKGEEDQVPCLVWTAVTIQAVLGVAGALVLVGITPLLVEHVLNIPRELVGEAKATFYLLAFSIPLSLIFSSFQGILEAAQRFDLVNAIRIPSSILSFILPLLGLFLGFNLPGIIVLILVAKLGILLALVLINFHLTPQLRRYSTSFSLFPRLFSFGGWITVSSAAVPILVYLDRFLIGSLLSMAAVAFYVVPYEIVTRLWIIAGSLTMTIFPAFSALEGIKDRYRIGFIFARAVKYILLVLGPIVLIIGLFAQDILQVWIGVEFALKSSVVLQILALGVLINSIAHIPSALLQGAGQPDIPAKFHLLQLPLYVGIVWFSVNQWGIAGAAGAWTFRVTLDAILLFVVTFKVYGLEPRLLVANGTILTGFALAVLAGTIYSLKIFIGDFSLPVLALIVSALFCLFAWFSWRNILDTLDREMILKLVKL